MTDQHASDCAVHNEPATPNGLCDCTPADAAKCRKTPLSPNVHVEAKFMAQAVPYVAQLEVAHSAVASAMDQVWEQAKVKLTPKDWQGFRPGSDAFRPKWEEKFGLMVVYGTVWYGVIEQAVSSQRKFLLDVAELHVVKEGEGVDEKYKISSLIYYMPEVKLAEKLDNIPIEVYSVHDSLVNNAVTQKIEKLVAKHQSFVPSLSPIKEGFKADINIMALLDGKPWGAATNPSAGIVVKHNKVFPEELYHALLNRKTGDEFEVVCESLPNIYGPDAKKKFAAQVKVNGVHQPDVETSDAILKRAGYASLAEANKVISEEVRDEMTKNRESNKYDLALHNLRSKAEFGPIPMTWLRTRANEEYARVVKEGIQRKLGRDEKEVLTSYKTTKGGILAELTGQIADLLRDETVILQFAHTHEKIDWSVGSRVNFPKAKEFMLSKIVMTEIEPLSARSRDVKKAEAAVANDDSC